MAKIWKQPKCLSTDEYIKMQYIYTMEYYSVIKKNNAVFSNMDRPRDYHVKWSNSRYHICHLYVKSKGNTSELIYKTETNAQT